MVNKLNLKEHMLDTMHRRWGFGLAIEKLYFMTCVVVTYPLDLVYQLFKVVATIDVDLKAQLEMLYDYLLIKLFYS